MTARHLVNAMLIGLLGMPMLAHAQAAGGEDKKPKCADMKSIDYRETWKADDRVINERCVPFAADPPLEWRRGLVNVGGAGGFSIANVAGPKDSAGREGANASVSGSVFNFTMNFPPWRGFPCQLPGGGDICGGGSGGGTGGSGGTGTGTTPSCALAAASAGLGGQQAISGSSAIALPCGGALPLSTYQLTLNPNPAGLFATEAGSTSYWSYQRSGSQFAQVSAANAHLPTHLCRKNSDGDWVKSVDLKPAIAQMITYSSGASSIAVRLQGENPAHVVDPFNPTPSAEPEKFLIVPIKNGVPDVPGNCADETKFYKPLPSLTDALMVQSATTPGCEGGTEVCGTAPTTPTASGSCDTVTLNPTGTTSTASGPVTCDGKVLIAVIDRPNIIYPPGSTANVSAIQGRTAVMAAGSTGARLYAQYETIVYFGASGGEFNLPEGGILKLDNGGTLEMKRDAKIRASSGQVILPNGGLIMSQGGVLLQTLGNNTTLTPPAARPFVVRLGRNLDLPASYLAPSQPNPYVQLPVSTQ